MEEEIKKAILKVKNAEINTMKSFDGLKEKLGKALIDYKNGMKDKREAEKELKELLSKSDIPKNKINEMLNEVKPTVKSKISQIEFISLVKKIDYLRKLSR